MASDNTDSDRAEGFIIECGQNQEALSVTTEQFARMNEKCDYFRNVFAHGTIESSTRVLKKPDWSLATAKHVIELASTGETKVKDLAAYKELREAASQVLLDVEDDAFALLPSFIKKPTKREGSNDELMAEFFHLVEHLTTDEPQIILETSKKISHTVWNDKLLSLGIIVTDKMPPKISVKAKGQRSATIGAFNLTVGFLGCFEVSEVSVCFPQHTSLSWALQQVCLEFCRENESNKVEFHREQFWLRVPCNLGMRGLLGAVEKASGACSYLHTGDSLGFYLDGSNDDLCPTFTGTSSQLNNALSLIKEDVISTYHDRLTVSRCSLRVSAPTTKTLDRLIISACHQCQDNPGTLGVDISANAFYAVKTVRDMKSILGVLSANTGYDNRKPASPLKVIDLGYPKGVF